jgi:hypothetical protein
MDCSTKRLPWGLHRRTPRSVRGGLCFRVRENGANEDAPSARLAMSGGDVPAIHDGSFDRLSPQGCGDVELRGEGLMNRATFGDVQ